MSYRFPEHVPGGGVLLLAVGLPIIAITAELVTGRCASAFFEPMPTFWHLRLVLTVPIFTLLLWMVRRSDAVAAPRWLAIAAGAGMRFRSLIRS